MSTAPSPAADRALHYRMHFDPKSSHQQIAAAARRFNRSPVLDVGAAQGFFGQLLEESGLDVDGIEPVEAWAETARPHYRNFFVSTIEDADLPDGTYRTVICGDVLEHLSDPVSALKQLCACSTDDAVFLISLPNVAHIAVRLMLLGGFFPRVERGILDRTHLQFLTRSTATDMLREAGLKVVRSTPTGVPMDEIFKSPKLEPLARVLTRVQHVALRCAPGLFGFQWVFVAKKA